MLIITYISLSIIISILTLVVAKNFLRIVLDEKTGTQKIHKKLPSDQVFFHCFNNINCKCID